MGYRAIRLPYLTTQRYINMAQQVKQAVERLHVSDVQKKSTG